MTKRIVLYGYTIEKGEYICDESAAAVIRRIYSMYTDGASYNGIAEMLNTEGTIYLEERPLWNKHLIKRILQNRKYLGEGYYPRIVSDDQFRLVQEIIAAKNENRKKRDPKAFDKVWDYTVCGACGGKLYRTGGGPKDKSIAALKCRDCGTVLRVSKARLEQEITGQFADYQNNIDRDYTPSAEVIRIQNAIDRGIESPEHPEELIRTILAGITARYSCCHAGPRLMQISSLQDINWQQFDRSVSAICIAESIDISLQFKGI